MARGKARAWLLLAAVALMASAAAAVQDFSADELRQIAAFGPWPPAPAFDAGNALAKRPQAVALGRELFFEPRLSRGGSMACASCHQADRAFSDGRAKAVGRVELTRNTPSLWNTVHQRWYGWDGASDSLWSQALRALTAADEMAATPAHLQQLLRSDAALARRFEAATGEKANDDAERIAVLMAKALGAWVGSLVSARTPFDHFRDAVLRGDATGAALYPEDAQRGLRLFIGRGRCTLCHGGPTFSHGEFADIGLPFFARPGVVDPGRHGGIALLRASRFNLLGPWSDEPGGAAALKTRHVEPQHRNFGEFKVPPLRGVAQTAPYMHDGQLATLAEVIRHYAELKLERLHADGERVLEPLRLSGAQAADLEAFLRSLSVPAQHSGVIESHPAFSSKWVQPRDVQVWLPPGYAANPAQRFPVLYLHDGQNVFAAPAGGDEWQMDETALGLMQGGAIAPAIIVAVASVDAHLADYTPWPMQREGRSLGGGAAAYGRFLVEELKPFVDQRYRTKSSRDDTAVGGSSLGGLVSMWLVLHYPQVFGAALVVSPSVWWADQAILREVANARHEGTPPRLWLSIGQREGDEAVQGARQLRQALQGRATLHYLEVPEATHDERAWAAQAAGMLGFLWGTAR